MAIDYASLVGFVDETNSMAQLVEEKFKLDERQQLKLKSIVVNVNLSNHHTEHLRNLSKLIINPLT